MARQRHASFAWHTRGLAEFGAWANAFLRRREWQSPRVVGRRQQGVELSRVQFRVCLGQLPGFAQSQRAQEGGMPGWSIALSANGQAGGIVWGMIPYGDASHARLPTAGCWRMMRRTSGRSTAGLVKSCRSGTARPGTGISCIPNSTRPRGSGWEGNRADVRWAGAGLGAGVRLSVALKKISDATGLVGNP